VLGQFNLEMGWFNVEAGFLNIEPVSLNIDVGSFDRAVESLNRAVESFNLEVDRPCKRSGRRYLAENAVGRARRSVCAATGRDGRAAVQ
jgi:hypothetical protein